MELKNIGNIQYDDENLRKDTGEVHNNVNKNTPDYIWKLRCPFSTPTNFRQKLLTDLYGEDFIDNAKKVLEIGFGCGRNAQFFVNESHIKYYSFDISEVGLRYFKAQGFPENRFYASLDIDKTILSQKYDLIYSTFVLHHIGFLNNQECYDAARITDIVFPRLKKGGYWVSYEGFTGDNGWRPKTWYKTCFVDKKLEEKIEVKHKTSAILEGSAETAGHELWVIKKL